VLDLFTPQDIVDLARTLQIQLENWIQEELKSIKNVDITYTKDPNNTEDPMTPECVGDLMTSVYKDCLKNDTGVFELESFLFEKNKITFYHQACAPHVIQAGDSIGEISNTFTFKALVPYLSEYGKKLLFQKNSNQAHLENIFNKVLYGKIGQHQVIMLLSRLNEDNSFSGVYSYQTEKKPIEISGELLNGEFTLKEAVSEIKAKLVNGVLVGEWQESETFKFEVAP
jgi:hypothetical protein